LRIDVGSYKTILLLNGLCHPLKTLSRRQAEGVFR
jgi:hypothetical protein